MLRPKLDCCSASSDLHCSVLEGVVITLEWFLFNSISIASMSSTMVSPIEVAWMAPVIPPRSSICHSTVNTMYVIVLVKCTEGCTIVSSQRITCCACIATNVEAILEKAVSGKSLHSIKVSEGHFQLGVFYSRSEAVNVLPSQPVYVCMYTPEVVQPPAYTSLQLRGRRLGQCSPVK